MELKLVTSSSTTLKRTIQFIQESPWLSHPFRGTGGLHQYILSHCLSIQHANDAMTIAGIMLRVCYHDDSGPLLIQIGEHLHYFASVMSIKITCRLVGEYKFLLIHNSSCKS